jgi:hypothetical protein
VFQIPHHRFGDQFIAPGSRNGQIEACGAAGVR